MVGEELRECSLFSVSIKEQEFDEAMTSFLSIEENAGQEHTLAILYAPNQCFLGKIEKDGTITSSSVQDSAPGRLSESVLGSVFEARVFNQVCEMRWLNNPNGHHTTAILSEKKLNCDGRDLESDDEVIGGLEQKYLLWGKEVEPDGSNRHPSGWTRFATARIGSYYVPIALKRGQSYARFTAVEYLRSYYDGNVAVVDERLTGIEGYDGGQDNG